MEAWLDYIYREVTPRRLQDPGRSSFSVRGQRSSLESQVSIPLGPVLTLYVTPVLHRHFIVGNLVDFRF